tara:strand:- start:600 stop:1271 length:672 start_codon:yes stop_codon:yes gene_type:complete
MDHTKLVKDHFEIKYTDYDQLIRNLIPKYEEMHNLVVENIHFSKDLKILDLGIGTGQTSLQILKQFPQAKIDGVDISKSMLVQAKARLKDYNVQFFESDAMDFKFEKKYDAAVAVLSLHHLNSNQKQEFFKRVYKTLRDDGVFIIADIIKFDSVSETKEKEKEWKKFLINNLGEKEGNYWFDNYLEEDLPDSVNNQLKWLIAAGFKAECIWEHLNYAVIVARK